MTTTITTGTMTVVAAAKTAMRRKTMRRNEKVESKKNCTIRSTSFYISVFILKNCSVPKERKKNTLVRLASVMAIAFAHPHAREQEEREDHTEGELVKLEKKKKSSKSTNESTKKTLRTKARRKEKTTRSTKHFQLDFTI